MSDAIRVWRITYLNPRRKEAIAFKWDKSQKEALDLVNKSLKRKVELVRLDSENTPFN